MWEDIAFVKQSKTAIEILKRLQEPKTPSELAKQLNLHQQSVSSTLAKLQERGLTECITPKRHNYRHYQITTKGNKILKVL
jgi:Mn-dependent DtxR family transcriptional regulator